MLTSELLWFYRYQALLQYHFLPLLNQFFVFSSKSEVSNVYALNLHHKFMHQISIHNLSVNVLSNVSLQILSLNLVEHFVIGHPGGSRKGPLKQDLSVLPSALLSGNFLGIISLVLHKCQNGARNLCEVVRDSQVLLKKKFSSQDWENGLKLGPKQGFFYFNKTFGH